MTQCPMTQCPMTHVQDSKWFTLLLLTSISRTYLHVPNLTLREDGKCSLPAGPEKEDEMRNATYLPLSLPQTQTPVSG